ncbi:unnamed protein product, partial [Effrenium voratum]
NNRQLFDEVNPLAEMMQARRITQVSELGLDKIKRIQSIRLIHSTQYGRVCPIETGEGMSAGLVSAMAANVRLSKDGEMQAPHQQVISGKRLTLPWRYLPPREQLQARVVKADRAFRPNGSLAAPVRPKRGGEVEEPDWQDPAKVPVTHLGLFATCLPEQVEYMACGAPTSPGVGLIPFVEHDDANRQLMGAKHQQQAVPTLWPERPVVGSGLEAHVAAYSDRTRRAGLDGQVLCSDGQNVTVARGVVRQADPIDQELRQRLRGLYQSSWASIASFEDFNELCMRSSTDELQRLAAIFSDPKVEVGAKERELASSLQRAGVDKSLWMPLALGLQEEPLPELPLPEGWEETEYCVHTEMIHHALKDAGETKKHTLAHDTPVAEAGEVLCEGDVVAEGQGISGGELALGKNLVVAYMPYKGYNYEDAIVISQRCVREQLLTSVHVEELVKELSEGEVLQSPDGLDFMENGMVQEGTWLQAGDAAICTNYKTLQVPDGVQGRVIDSSVRAMVVPQMGELMEKRVAVVLLAVQCPIQIGDKLSGRHGNKGIVSIIEDENNMPYLPDGTCVDVCLNPLGVPSRMNVGQIFENILSSAGRWNGEEYRVGSFDEMYAEEASRGLVLEALRRAQEGTGNKWLLDAAYPGKTKVYDGRTGLPLDQPVTVGISYIIKLCHMIKDKIHVRESGGRGYNVITQQPIKGRSKGGGLRMGEMEVSGLIGHGAPFTLQELLTLKSDDLQGRIESFDKISRGQDIELPAGATPEGYLAFTREVEAAGIAVTSGSWSHDDDE